ncbi:MAG TPA: hypothetical protein VGU71_22265 [Candidatus Dormibacteraeota bacterium]|nr:hypothetical protein [Candidatus Dormibacteraeota bacterium]
MSFGGAKAQLKTALQTVTWIIPASAAAITAPALLTAFGRVDTQQFAGEDAAVPASQFPYCRISIPELDEKRKTDGGDAISQKAQIFPAHMFIYMAGYNKDWQGLADYFDAVIDATLAYFRNNSSPSPGIVSPGNNDHIVGWGLHQRARIELAEQIDVAVNFRATVAVDLHMRIV